MVDVITAARDAERAVEEAKMALRKAEVAEERARGGVREVAALVAAVGRI